MAISEAMRRANRANALRSTGPRTAAGKAQSRLNACKHGMTGRAVALPEEDRADVARLEARLAERFAPRGGEEQELVREMAMALWRIGRAPKVEAAVLDAACASYDRSLDAAVATVDDLLRIGRYAGSAERAYRRGFEGLVALRARRQAAERLVPAPRRSSEPQFSWPNGFVLSKQGWPRRTLNRGSSSPSCRSSAAALRTRAPPRGPRDPPPC